MKALPVVMVRIVLMFGLFGCIGPVSAAPSQLFGKTIVLSWNTNSNLKYPDGTIHTNSSTQSKSIYVSDKGRVFIRSAFTSNGRPKAFDCDPGTRGSCSHTNEGTGWHFEGNKLVNLGSLVSGGFHGVASFDPGFSSCTLEIVYGKENGQNIKYRWSDGKVYEIISYTTGGFTCSIKEGNVFAN